MLVHDQLRAALPKQDLHRIYFVEKMSTTAIARNYGVSQSCIYNLFKEYGLRTRTLKEAMALSRKPL
ncbi:MAG: hypothetical protein OK436_07765, partial [Thaumarchaeota archaeon]|nr:hypothetical protein [Nitrososphaerota archaeon]